MAETDYRDLLKRYMAHVCYEEGTDFLGFLDPEEFTPQEVGELDAISDEIGSGAKHPPA